MPGVMSDVMSDDMLDVNVFVRSNAILNVMLNTILDVMYKGIIDFMPDSALGRVNKRGIYLFLDLKC